MSNIRTIGTLSNMWTLSCNLLYSSPISFTQRTILVCLMFQNDFRPMWPLPKNLSLYWSPIDTITECLWGLSGNFLEKIHHQRPHLTEMRIPFPRGGHGGTPSPKGGYGGTPSPQESDGENEFETKQNSPSTSDIPKGGAMWEANKIPLPHLSPLRGVGERCMSDEWSFFNIYHFCSLWSLLLLYWMCD